MSRVRYTIACLMGLVAAAALVSVCFRFNRMLGVVVFVLLGMGFGAYLLRDDLLQGLDRVLGFLGRPVGWPGRVLLGFWIVAAPYILFYDPIPFALNPTGYIPREPRSFYLLVSDDVAYVAASRTWDRTLANLLVPHNTHIVPAWRLVTWALVACAGNLQGLPDVLSLATYGILVAVMLMAGRLVARETGRAGAGLAAMALTGTTSLMLTPAMWYSGGQPLWAAFGILASLWYAQCYRRDGRRINLVLSSLAGAAAGGIWSAGHLAGPATAVYLWFDGRRRCRLAAAVPLGATAVTVAFFLAMASRPIDSSVSFHGRTVSEAANPVQGAITTAQAIPENLVFGNAGLSTLTTPGQGLVMTIGLLAFWASRRWRRDPGSGLGGSAAPTSLSPSTPPSPESGPNWPRFAFNPLESAGLAMVLGCYLLEWTARGYLEYHNLRTISPYMIVPWYDVIPQVGAVLFVLGWWSGPAKAAGWSPRALGRRGAPLTRLAALGLATMTLVLIVLNRPRVDALIRGTAPPLLASEEKIFKIPSLVTKRASALISVRVDAQRRYLRGLDHAEPIARRLGIGQDGIRAAFGFQFIPSSTGRLLMNQRELYDVAAILDLPARGRATDPLAIRAALGPYLIPGPEIRPFWIGPDEKWPPE